VVHSGLCTIFELFLGLPTGPVIDGSRVPFHGIRCRPVKKGARDGTRPVSRQNVTRPTPCKDGRHGRETVECYRPIDIRLISLNIYLYYLSIVV